MTRNTSSPFRILAITLLVANVVIVLIGFISLFESPYVGLHVLTEKDQAIIREVVAGSAAEKAGIQVGDLILDVNDLALPPVVFIQDPDSIISREEQKVFWQEYKRLNREIVKGQPFSLLIANDGKNRSVTLVAEDFPFSKALFRTSYFYITAWAFLLSSLLLLRKKANEITAAYFLFGAFTCATISAAAPFCGRDLAFSPLVFQFLSTSNIIAALLILPTIFHFALVFPRRNKLLDTHPRLLQAAYGGAAILLLLQFFPPLDNKLILFDYPMLISCFYVAGILAFNLFKEQSPVYRKQIQWVVLGFSISFLWIAVTIFLPPILAQPFLPFSVVLLPIIIMPVSIVIAVTRYRLMDIESIFDYGIVYGLTIIILQIGEFVLLGTISPHLPASQQMPFLSVFAILLIVFCYIPIRNLVKKSVEIIFRRGTYNLEEEIKRFLLILGTRDHVSALDRFAAYVKGLFVPSGILIFSFGRLGAEMVFSDGQDTASVAEKVAEAGSRLQGHFRRYTEAALGFELKDSGILKETESTSVDIESALFLPFNAGGETIHIAVLLPKWNGLSYSKKDMALLEALASSMTHVLQAEERRRELESERLRLAQEIHDGISCEFTGIISFCEKGERSTAPASEPRELTETFAFIADSARRGIREIRNVLLALHPEGQSLGYLCAYLKRYATDLLSAAGIVVQMSSSDEHEDHPLPPHAILLVFRTVQEACHNVLKHANATTVHIALHWVANGLKLEFVDDGQGFHPETATRMEGMGLKNMKKRVDESGGSIAIASAPGVGTVIRAELPLCTRQETVIAS